MVYFVELNYEFTQYCTVLWHFSWYSITRYVYGIVTTLLYAIPKLKRALFLLTHIVSVQTNLVKARESKLWDAAGCWSVFGTRNVHQISLRACSSPELVLPPACGSSRLDSASGSGSDGTTWWASCDWGPPDILKGLWVNFKRKLTWRLLSFVISLKKQTIYSLKSAKPTKKHLRLNKTVLLEIWTHKHKETKIRATKAV